jgi:ubiquinone/menaquinone biosynthesis C-methylase UbiE
MSIFETEELINTAELVAIKGRQQQAWAAGDFSLLAVKIILVSEELCETVDLRPGQKVLDVATGSGNTALAAARRECEVTGIDYVESLVEQARLRAATERLRITFQVGDAEKLHFPDGSFDAVLSTFGVMFAPNQEEAAQELLRVCRSGGKIGMANWTPDSFIGTMFRTIAGYVPPPPTLKPPTLWGTEERLRELFSEQLASLRTTKRNFIFRFRSPEQWLNFHRSYFGPLVKVYELLSVDKHESLSQDLLALVRRYNRSGDETVVLPGEYLEVVVTKI